MLPPWHPAAPDDLNIQGINHRLGFRPHKIPSFPFCSASCLLCQRKRSWKNRTQEFSERNQSYVQYTCHSSAHKYFHYPWRHRRNWVLILSKCPPPWFTLPFHPGFHCCKEHAKCKETTTHNQGQCPVLQHKAEGCRHSPEIEKPAKKGCVGVHEFYLHNYPVI